MKKRYLVTGGAGFIGSNLVDKLLNDQFDVVVIDDLSSGLLSNLNDIKKIQFIEKKVQDVEPVEVGTVDGIYHLAAQASVPLSINNFYNSTVNNLQSSFKIFDLAKKLKIPIVFASSSAVYGNLPVGDDKVNRFDILSPYAQDKLTVEDYARLFKEIYNVSSIGFRFFNVYGPRQDPKNPYSGVISIFIDNLLNNSSVTVNGGYQTRDFIFVKDVVDVLVMSMIKLHNRKMYNVFNLGSGNSININELLDNISKILKINPNIIFKKLPAGDPEVSKGNFKKIEESLKVNLDNFVDLQTGLEQTIKFFKECNK